MKYTKQQYLQIICEAAQTYEKELCGNTLLLVYGSIHNLHLKEIEFTQKGFQHLTGTNCAINDPDGKKLFYQKALNHKLSVNDFNEKDDGTTRLKMETISIAMRIATNVNLAGDFRNNKLKLKADNTAGATEWCIALRNKGNGIFVPVSLLNDDLRNNSDNYDSVLAVLRRPIKEKKYCEVSYVSKNKNIDMTTFMTALLNRVHEKNSNLLGDVIFEVEINRDSEGKNASSSSVGYRVKRFEKKDDGYVQASIICENSKAKCNEIAHEQALLYYKNTNNKPKKSKSKKIHNSKSQKDNNPKKQ